MKNSKHLALAARHGKPTRVAELLATGVSPDSSCPGEGRIRGPQTALQWAVQRESAQCVRLLLEAGADPRLTLADDEAPPLASAAMRDSTDCLEALLAAGLDPDTPMKSGSTALVLAVLFRRIECARLLLSKGADMDATDRRGDTPLMHAAHHGEVDFLRELIEAGADVAAKNHKGMTALARAAGRGHAGCIALLEEIEMRATVANAPARAAAKRI